MERYILILIIVIISVILIYHFNNKNEHYMLSPTLDIQKIKDTTKHYYYNKDNRRLQNINVKKDIEIRDRSLRDMLIQFKYPVGSFYVQYPDVNKNISTAEVEIILFPEAKTPQTLFGGKWEEQWSKEAVFFRTQGALANERRQEDGVQEWAVKNLYGETAYAQANYNDTTGGVSGVFTVQTKRGRTDDGRDNDNGGHATFDSSAMVNPSNFETRVRNRVIKVWRRLS